MTDRSLSTLAAHVLLDYPTARGELRRADHPVHETLGELRARIEALIAEDARLSAIAWRVRASTGRARTWAEVCWVAVMHPVETRSAEDGRYVALLFDTTGRHLVLGIAWGTNALRRASPGGEVAARLRARRDAMCPTLSALRAQGALDESWQITADVSLGGSGQLAKDYEKSLLISKTYTQETLLTDDRDTLQEALRQALYVSLSLIEGEAA